MPPTHTHTLTSFLCAQTGPPRAEPHSGSSLCPSSAWHPEVRGHCLLRAVRPGSQEHVRDPRGARLPQTPQEDSSHAVMRRGPRLCWGWSPLSECSLETSHYPGRQTLTQQGCPRPSAAHLSPTCGPTDGPSGYPSNQVCGSPRRPRAAGFWGHQELGLLSLGLSARVRRPLPSMHSRVPGTNPTCPRLGARPGLWHVGHCGPQFPHLQCGMVIST